MKLTKNTYLNHVGSNVYVLQTKADRSFLFNEIVYEILKLIQENPGIDYEQIYQKIADIYACDEEPLRQDLAECINMLYEKGIIEDDIPSQNAVLKTPEDYLNQYCIENKIIEGVTIELTYRCNERCVHCYVSDADKDITTELTTTQIYKLLDELRKLNVLNITFTGGEVALRKDFLDILCYAKKLGFVVSIFTNGIGFSEEDIDVIISCAPRAVSCSLYSGIPEEHEAITQIKGSFQKTLYFLMRLKCAGIMVNVKTPVMRTTKTGFEQLHTLCKQLNFQHQVSYLICSTNKGCMSPTKFRIGDLEEFKKIMRAASNDNITGTTEPRKIDAPICGAGFCTLSIDPYGNVYPCNGYSVLLGSILTDSVSDIWNSEKLKELRKLTFRNLDKKCQTCKYIDDCLYCPGAMLMENDDIRKPIPEVCIISQASYELRQELGKL